jgi:hypothetical protein
MLKTIHIDNVLAADQFEAIERVKARQPDTPLRLPDTPFKTHWMQYARKFTFYITNPIGSSIIHSPESFIRCNIDKYGF